MSVEIIGYSKSDDGHLACVFSNGSLAVIHESPPTDKAVLDAAQHFLPGREPFYIRRSKRLPQVVYVYPMDAEIEPLTDDELAELDARHPRFR